MTEMYAGRNGEQIPVTRYSANGNTFETISVRRSNGEIDEGWYSGDIISAPDGLSVEVFKRKPDNSGDMKKTIPLGQAMDLNPRFTKGAIEYQYGLSLEQMHEGETKWDSLGSVDHNPWSLENYQSSSLGEASAEVGVERNGFYNNGTTPVENPGPMAVRQASIQTGSGIEAHGMGIYSKGNK